MMSLGPPIRPDPKQPTEEWVEVPGRPWLERNTVTKVLRTKLPDNDHSDRPWPFPTGRGPR